MAETSSSFKILLRNLRRSRGLSQQQFAKLIGVSTGQTISNWERGYGSSISMKHLRLIVKKFGLDPNKTLDAYLNDEKEKLKHLLIKEWKG